MNEVVQKFILANPHANVAEICGECLVSPETAKKELERVSSNLEIIRAEVEVTSLLDKLPRSRVVQLLDYYTILNGGTPPVRNGSSPYASLSRALDAAYEQCAGGKGHQRHSADRTFDQQPIMSITRTQGIGFPLGQASKKIDECTRMDTEPARAEILGAIVYLAAAWLHLGDD